MFAITRHGAAFLGLICLGEGCFDKIVDIYLDIEGLQKRNLFLSMSTACCDTLSVPMIGELSNALPGIRDRVIW